MSDNARQISWLYASESSSNSLFIRFQSCINISIISYYIIMLFFGRNKRFP